MESLKLILISIFITFISFFNPSFCYPHSSLDTLIHNYVNNRISFSPTTPRTGVIRNLIFPSLNSSTIKLSVVRLRTGSLWTRGKNISAFKIPSMIIPIPYVKRLVLVTSIMDQNLSSYYFTPPQGYVFASPVLGLAVYNASTTAFVSNISVDINVAGGPIFVTFGNVIDNAVCVGFSKDGVGAGLVLGTMSKPGECSVYGQGYFATAVRDTRQGSSGSGSRSSRRKWVVGVVILMGLMGLLVMSFVGILIWKMMKRKKIKEMERQSEKEVGVGRMWVGQSRLPTGNMCRTQPQLENEMFP